MTKTVGIIPAGGEAVRFDGLAKELLPVSQAECGLTRCVRAMQTGGATEVIVLSSWNKFSLHVRALRGLAVQIVAADFAGVWETIVRGAETPADHYYFAMPDTIFPPCAFHMTTTDNVQAGVFYTTHPERYGMLRGRNIVDKQSGPPGWAWGLWVWSAAAMDCLALACRQTRDHTRALNRMLGLYPARTFQLAYYHDFAAFRDYQEYLCSLS